MQKNQHINNKPSAADTHKPAVKPIDPSSKPNTVPETGGFDGAEPTRYGDWVVNGRCTDF